MRKIYIRNNQIDYALFSEEDLIDEKFGTPKNIKWSKATPSSGGYVGLLSCRTPIVITDKGFKLDFTWKYLDTGSVDWDNIFSAGTHNNDGGDGNHGNVIICYSWSNNFSYGYHLSPKPSINTSINFGINWENNKLSYYKNGELVLQESRDLSWVNQFFKYGFYFNGSGCTQTRNNLITNIKFRY